MTWRSNWGQTLSPEQRTAVIELKKVQNAVKMTEMESDSFWVRCHGTTGPARRVWLVRKFSDLGVQLVWEIGRDGSVGECQREPVVFRRSA